MFGRQLARDQRRGRNGALSCAVVVCGYRFPAGVSGGDGGEQQPVLHARGALAARELSFGRPPKWQFGFACVRVGNEAGASARCLATLGNPVTLAPLSSYSSRAFVLAAQLAGSAPYVARRRHWRWRYPLFGSRPTPQHAVSIDSTAGCWRNCRVCALSVDRIHTSNCGASKALLPARKPASQPNCLCARERGAAAQ